MTIQDANPPNLTYIIKYKSLHFPNKINKKGWNHVVCHTAPPNSIIFCLCLYIRMFFSATAAKGMNTIRIHCLPAKVCILDREQSDQLAVPLNYKKILDIIQLYFKWKLLMGTQGRQK